MSHISETTLKLVRDRDTVTLDWLLHETIGRAARLTSAEVVAARDVIHATMVNAGWHCTRDEAGAGGATIWYQRRPGMRTASPSEARLEPRAVPATATWGLSLDCECPACGEWVDLTTAPDFWDGKYPIQPCEHGTRRTDALEVKCPECGDEFVVKCHY